MIFKSSLGIMFMNKWNNWVCSIHSRRTNILLWLYIPLSRIFRAIPRVVHFFVFGSLLGTQKSFLEALEINSKRCSNRWLCKKCFVICLEDHPSSSQEHNPYHMHQNTNFTSFHPRIAFFQWQNKTENAPLKTIYYQEQVKAE